MRTESAVDDQQNYRSNPMRAIRRMCLKNRPMSLRKISSSFNVGRSVHVALDTDSKTLAKYGLHSHRRLVSRLSLQSNGKEE